MQSQNRINKVSYYSASGFKREVFALKQRITLNSRFSLTNITVVTDIFSMKIPNYGSNI